MEFLLFMIFSSIDWFALFSLTLTIFMFRIKGHLLQILFASLIMSQFSFLLHDAGNLAVIAPGVQFIIVFLFLWVMFRIHIFYAAIMAAFGYLWYLSIQSILLLGLGSLKILTIEQIMAGDSLLYLLQVIKATIVFLTCWFSFRFRLGFSFVPNNNDINLSLKGENLRFLILVILAAVTISIYYLSALKGFFLLLFFIMAGILGLLLYTSIEREKSIVNSRYS